MTDAQRQRLARHAALSQARGLTREVGIREEFEFLAALQNIHASVNTGPTRLADWNAKLLELITDIDAEINELPPEAPEYGSERAQFDARTPMSNRPGREL